MTELVPLNSKQFSQLDWKDQLAMIKVKLEDPERYDKEVEGIVASDPKMAKMMEDLAFLVESQSRQVPKPDGFPITLIPHWIACQGWLDLTQHRHTLEKLNIEHKVFINTLLIRAPILIVKHTDRNILKFLNSKRSIHKQYGLDLMKVQTYFDLDMELGGKTWKDVDYQEHVRKALSLYKDTHDFDDLVGRYPVVSMADGYSKRFADGEMVLYWPRKRKYDLWWSAPMFPFEFTVDGWQLKNWHYLL